MISGPEFIDQLYSLDSLTPLDTTTPEGMAEFILGAYRMNAQAEQQVANLIEEDIDLPAHEKGFMVLSSGIRAGENLSVARNLLGNRALELTALREQGEPILYRGATPVQHAIGTPDHFKRRLSGSDLNTLQIFTKPSVNRFSNKDKSDWWIAKVLDEDSQPLIDIQVVDMPKKSFVGIARNLIRGSH